MYTQERIDVIMEESSRGFDWWGCFPWVTSLRTYHARHMVMTTTMRAVSWRGSNSENNHSGPMLTMLSTFGMGQSIAIALHSSIARGAPAHRMEYVLLFHTTEGTHISKIEVTREFIGPSCKRVAHEPPSKDAYLRGSRAPPYGLPDGTTTIRCPTCGDRQWTLTLVQGEAVGGANGEHTTLFRTPCDNIISDASGHTDVGDGMHVHQEKIPS